MALKFNLPFDRPENGKGGTHRKRSDPNAFAGGGQHGGGRQAAAAVLMVSRLRPEGLELLWGWELEKEGFAKTRRPSLKQNSRFQTDTRRKPGVPSLRHTQYWGFRSKLVWKQAGSGHEILVGLSYDLICLFHASPPAKRSKCFCVIGSSIGVRHLSFVHHSDLEGDFEILKKAPSTIHQKCVESFEAQFIPLEDSAVCYGLRRANF